MRIKCAEGMGEREAGRVPPFSRSKPIRRDRTNPKDNAEMVYVPSGHFLMGDADGPENAKPVHYVQLGGYWIYQTPVTVGQYARFCEETGNKMPPAPRWGWKDDHPVVNVTWYNASAYAVWAEARLPTEAEWEKAARGGNGRIYPWGDEWDDSLFPRNPMNWNEGLGTSPVGSSSLGSSPYGALDMAGSVWQWVSDWYGVDYYKDAPERNPLGPVIGKGRVLRGGSWSYFIAPLYRSAFRYRRFPGASSDDCGFRCVVAP
jgi:serine/threonine-protein kinase